MRGAATVKGWARAGVAPLTPKRVLAFWRARHPPLIPSIIVVALLVTALFGPLFAPYGENEGALSKSLQPPFWQHGGSSAHLLGTDKFGRDILSRVIYGARVSVIIALVALLISGAVGVAAGMVAGYFGKWTDAVIMRLVDASMAIPLILIAIVLAVVRGASFQNVIIVTVALLWSKYARQIRGEVLSIKQRDYVALARTAGASNRRILIKHVWPQVMNTTVVLLTLQVGYVIVLEASLSFLGAGIPPPTATWGLMVADGRELITEAWWVTIFPGLAIMLTVLSLNLLGDWLRDALDPSLRQV